MQPPQPRIERTVPPSGHPLVCGVRPGQPELVVQTAALWARDLGVRLVCAFADPDRVVVREDADGTVHHAALDPDVSGDAWTRTDAELRSRLAALLDPVGIGWQFRYLAGRTDRALTHLARAVDASAIVVGARRPVPGERLRDLVAGSVAAGLSRHQHRPVITVPLEIVDWKQALR